MTSSPSNTKARLRLVGTSATNFSSVMIYETSTLSVTVQIGNSCAAFLLCSTCHDTKPCRDIKDQVLVDQKKQKVASDNGQGESKDVRPVSKSEMRKLKQIERRKEAQARVQGVKSFSTFHTPVPFLMDHL